MIDTKVYYKYF